MIFGKNVKTATAILRSSKWRSLLTIVGIVIGIVAVATTISIGEGVKRQIVGQINYLGKDLITIKPGKIVERDSSGRITRVHIASNYGFGSGSLAESDIQVVGQTKHIKQVSPVTYLNSPVKHQDRTLSGSFVLGVGSSYPEMIQQKIEFGSGFSESEGQKHVAIIGKRVAETLFGENAPIGMTISVRGQDFIVRGVFEEFSGSLLSGGTDYNKGVFIPYQTSKQLAGGSIPIVQILARPDDSNKVNEVIGNLTNNLSMSRSGDEDFTILKQDENLAVTNNILNLLTGMIAGVAAISLLVGGIGIMNIMLVSVTERTKEIGIRKAIGATNRQIMSQFLTEATVLSVFGGIIGIVVTVVIVYGLHITTNLKPILTWQVVLFSALVTMIVGIVFGLAPAYKAARKNPIDALRHD